MDALIQSLVQANFAPERIAPQAPMAQYTTLRIGGPAEVMVNITRRMKSPLRSAPPNRRMRR